MEYGGRSGYYLSSAFVVLGCLVMGLIDVHRRNLRRRKRARQNKKEAAELNVETGNRPDEIPLQKLLFSATLSRDPEILQQLNLYEPKMFTTSVDPSAILAKVPEFSTPLELSEIFVKCDNSQLKPLLLHHLLTSKSVKKALIFAKSRDSSHNLAVLLKQFGLSVDELSSKVSLSQHAAFKSPESTLNLRNF